MMLYCFDIAMILLSMVFAVILPSGIFFTAFGAYDVSLPPAD